MKNTKLKNIVIYAPDAFGLESRKQYPMRAKTADGVIRYSNDNILAVIDPSSAEKMVPQVLPGTREIPIVKSVKEALKLYPTDFLLGTAPTGGELPKKWKKDIAMAIRYGLNIISGLHFEFNNDKYFKDLANEYRVKLVDVRVPPDTINVGSALAYNIKSKIILTVGTDAAIGKMTTSLELDKEVRDRGFKSTFIATGQTGIMISGYGISIDRVIGDFMAGAVESLVLDYADCGYKYLFVEGQGSLFHPGYSPVTLALIHGAVPTDLVLVHRPQRRHSIGSKLIKIPSLTDSIKAYENACLPIRPAKVKGITLNTWGLDEETALREIQKARVETGLPVTDVIRFGAKELVDSLI
jgi:uncharacterized NAD-dependent epimerase/dehydratase family protein